MFKCSRVITLYNSSMILSKIIGFVRILQLTEFSFANIMSLKCHTNLMLQQDGYNGVGMLQNYKIINIIMIFHIFSASVSPIFSV